MVINLLHNACQSLPEKRKGIVVSTGCNHDMTKIMLKISDEGMGIPSENLPHVKEPFFTTKEEVGGLGLGLAISSRIIEQHGGQIIFTSEPEKGTTVEISFPANKDK